MYGNSIMQHLHLKHVTHLIKLCLPNINITLDNDSINKLLFVYVYQKSTVLNDFPKLFPHKSDTTLRICGEINLENYPSTSPQTIIYGDIGHCHVYKIDETRYKVCHSLDRSFEWYFKNNQTSIFNPSMTLLHYVVNMYKFLAEDDRLHIVSDERCSKSLDYWSRYEFTQEFPEIELSYGEATDILNNVLYGPPFVHNVTGTLDPDHGEYIDFIDKVSLLASFEDIVLPISHDTKRSKHSLEVKVLNFTKLKYYEAGIRKTSQGYTFTNCVPIVAKSSLWKKEDFLRILNDEIEKMYPYKFSDVVITSFEKSNEGCYAYTIYELINELLQTIVADGSVKAYKGKLLLHMYHILLYILPNISLYIEKVLLYINTKDDISELIIPNLNVLIGILLYSKKNITDDIILEILYRMIYRSASKIINAKKVISLVGEKFIVGDKEGWINLIWVNSRKYIQSVALLKHFFKTMEHINLHEMDTMVEHIALDNNTVNEIILWENLQGVNGFFAFAKFMELDEIDYEEFILQAFEKFNAKGLDGNILNRWKYYGSYYSSYYYSMNSPSDIV